MVVIEMHYERNLQIMYAKFIHFAHVYHQFTKWKMNEIEVGFENVIVLRGIIFFLWMMIRAALQNAISFCLFTIK